MSEQIIGSNHATIAGANAAPDSPVLVTPASYVPSPFASVFEMHAHKRLKWQREYELIMLLAASPRRNGGGSAGVNKKCNCKKSACLKLYCECFAAGVMCNGCNCIDCHNNPSHSQDRAEAIEAVLDKNPHAFKPKIASSPIAIAKSMGKNATPMAGTPKNARGRTDAAAGAAVGDSMSASAAAVAADTPISAVDADTIALRQVHHKGCACKKSHCLKKYCECYQANVHCGEFCKCVCCHNYEGSRERDILEAKGRAQPVMSVVAVNAAQLASNLAAANGNSGNLSFFPTMAAQLGVDMPVRANGPPLTSKQLVEKQIAAYVPANSHSPWSGLLTDSLIKQMTHQLIEAANNESHAVNEHVSTQHADTLLLLASPQQPKTEGATDRDGSTTDGNSRRTPRTQVTSHVIKSLNHALSETDSAAAATTIPRASSPPSARLARHNRELLFESRAESELSGRAASASPVAAVTVVRPIANFLPASRHAISSPLSPSTKMPTLRFPSTTALTSQPILSSSGSSVAAASSSSSAALLSNVVRQQSQSVGAAPAPFASTAVALPNTMMESEQQRKRKREGDATGFADSLLPEEKKLKVESDAEFASISVPIASSSPSPDPALARPSTPHTSALMCEEQELPSPPVAATRTQAASFTAPRTPPRTSTSEYESSEASMYRQQEKVLLQEMAGLVSNIIQQRSGGGGQRNKRAPLPQVIKQVQ